MYRNDFAFSLVIHMMNGNIDHPIVSVLPGKKFYTLDKDVMIDISDDTFKFLLEKEKYLGEYIALKTQGIDVHVMNKYSLLRLIDDGK
jgi:hypothetical protein